MTTDDARRLLPSVDTLLSQGAVHGWIERYGREPVKAAIRGSLEAARAQLANDPEDVAPSVESLLGDAERRLESDSRPSLGRVLNGTGVVLHTNLGRAPLAPEAIAAGREAAGYGSVEFDLETGSRGSRYDHCTGPLRALTGAEAALVVNNNAAAVALAVNELAQGREVLVSRGELVEIGGSFRIPDVISRSGARLREVGTTNRTRLDDYRRSLGPEVGAILKVHPSNYRVEGFIASVTVHELVGLGRETGVPVVHDIGSGLLRADLLPGFPAEPTVASSLEAGADLVTWSGDKLFGGPQSGILLGSRDLVARLRRNPLLRAFRVDKITLAALEATLALYADPERAARRVPALRMLREPAEEIADRARAALDALDPPAGVRVQLERMSSVVGGGSFPGFEIPSAGIVVRGIDPEVLAARCRGGPLPLIGVIREGAFHLDFRTIAPGDEPLAAGVLNVAMIEG